MLTVIALSHLIKNMLTLIEYSEIFMFRSHDLEILKKCPQLVQNLDQLVLKIQFFNTSFFIKADTLD